MVFLVIEAWKERRGRCVLWVQKETLLEMRDLNIIDEIHCPLHTFTW